MTGPSKFAEPPTFAPAAPKKLSLLVVEDDEADAYLINRALVDNPTVEHVTRARDGIEALELVQTGEAKPDLAFIDLHMPRMNGFDLLVALRSNDKAGFPMVVLTSSTAQRDAVRSRLRNAVRVVVKPENAAELYGVLQTTIDAVCPETRPASRSLAEAPAERRFIIAPSADPAV